MIKYELMLYLLDKIKKVNKMSEYFRKYIKKEHYPLHQ